MKTYTAIYAIPEMIIVLIGVACIVWLVWTVREHKQANCQGCIGSGVARSAQ